MKVLLFQQKEDCGFTHEQILRANRQEISRYKDILERTHTRYQIVNEEEQENGSILVRVRKQYNDKADVSEYFA